MTQRIKFNSSGLPSDGPERAEAEQLFEDFMNRLAEEQLLLEEEERRGTYLVGPKEGEEK